MKTYTAKVTALSIGDHGDLGKEDVTSIEVELVGISCDRHRSFFRDTWSGDKQPEGTRRRNERQWSATSVEELAQIQGDMGLKETLTAASLGANICLEGIPQLSRLPKGTIMKFPSGAELMVEEYNPPCLDMGKKIAATYTSMSGEPLADTAFSKAAQLSRGLVGVIDVEGSIYVGDEVTIFPYEHPKWLTFEETSEVVELTSYQNRWKNTDDHLEKRPLKSGFGFTRRDFLNGVALGTGAAMVSPLEAMAHMAKLSPEALANQPYPPARTGLRGNHVGSFEVAHAHVQEGKTWDRPLDQTDDTYDLIVVGGGISGLAAAKLFRDRASRSIRILILDNHDDFGGHAKRNELEVDGQTLIGHGGSQSIEGPSSYSPVSAKLLRDISIDVERFYEYFDQGFSKRYGLENGIFFTSETFGADRLTPDPFRNYFYTKSTKPPEDVVNAFPVSDQAKASLIRMLTEETDYLPGLSHDEKTKILSKISYFDFLKSHVGLPDDAAEILREKFKGYWGLSWENLSALEGFRLGMPAMQNLGLDWDKIDPDGSDEPYIFHFPDGNAGIARLIVRDLIPGTLPGTTMEDSVLARLDYARLDEEGSPVRIRLNTTVVDVRHSADSDGVDVTCIKDGKASRVHGKHVILACNNRVIPHICPEVPKAQSDAINWATRAPLAYVNVAIRNWRALADLGYQQFYIPKGALTYSYTLDFPVSMGGYSYSPDPDQPMILHGTCVPNTPGEGLSAREQFVAGQMKLYQLSFDDFEKDTFRHLDGALNKGGFDAERDIAGLTVNRWPHGYAYEYNELYDPSEWNEENGPHVLGRAQMGRISIANSDASAYAYIDGAIDAADRAVNEQLA